MSTETTPETEPASPEQAIVESLFAEAAKYPSIIGLSLCLLASDGKRPATVGTRIYVALPPSAVEADLQGLVKVMEQNIHLGHLRAIPGALEEGMRLDAAPAERRADE